MIDAVPVEGDLFGYGLLLSPDRSPERGWFRFDLSRGALSETLQTKDDLETQARAWDFEALARPILAAVEGRGYALRFQEPPFLERIVPTARKLSAFPEGFGALPKMPEVRGAEAAAVRFRVIERSAIPVNLFGRGASLYLLTRRPMPRGTVWQLHQIEPQKDRLLRSLDLPTRAAHILLTPGPRFWAILEKGPVVRAGEQEISSMVLVPSGWIEDSASSVLSAGGASASEMCR